MLDILPYLAIAIILLVIAGYSLEKLFRRTTIWENQTGLRFYKGKYVKELGPGVYWTFRPNSRIFVIDTRPIETNVKGQEILSADGVSLKLSIHLRYRIADPLLCHNSCQSPYFEYSSHLPSQIYHGDLYSLAQIAARRAVGNVPIEELLQNRPELAENIRKLCENQALERGIEIMDLDILDIMFPGDLKKVFAQVVNARQEGLAALEKARGETAALRNLANAAKTLENNPALWQLRILHVLGESSGNTVVLGSPEIAPGLRTGAKQGEKQGA
jgi:regulator of protease activity HflC (stomatin/prohibitin superfamily)